MNITENLLRVEKIIINSIKPDTQGLFGLNDADEILLSIEKYLRENRKIENFIWLAARTQMYRKWTSESREILEAKANGKSVTKNGIEIIKAMETIKTECDFYNHIVTKILTVFPLP